jgi:formamidopyrimidine-DNA glycosylase
MPELPEVETVMRSLAPETVGARIVSIRGSRLAMRGGRPVDLAGFRRRIQGARIVGWRRRGKYLITSMSSGAAVLWHLGMSGRLLISPAAARRPPHCHLDLRLDRGRSLVLVDPRRFGLALCLKDADAVAGHPALARMGPEPLSRVLGAGLLARRLSGSRRPIKHALLDQTLVAGVGNIYASESLFVAGIDPRRESGTLTREELASLSRAIKSVLRRAIAACGTSLKDFTDGWGVQGEYRQQLLVFAREGERCTRCRAAVERIVQSGRSTFFCPRCQS